MSDNTKVEANELISVLFLIKSQSLRQYSLKKNIALALAQRLTPTMTRPGISDGETVQLFSSDTEDEED